MPVPPTIPDDPAARSERWCIRMRGVVKRFGSQEVLRGVDLDFERGKVNVVIGGSGQGKSVTLKLIIGLLKPDAGHIWVDGEDIVPYSDREMARVRRKFGMLFQYAALFDSLTVFENVAFPLVEHTRKSKDEIAEIVRARLASVNLHGIESKFPSELSGGMRKRVGLARALVLEPRILLYDEPTTGLDPISTKTVDDMIADVAAQYQVTSIVISHDMASTFRVGHRIAMLYEGRIVEVGTPGEIKRSRHEFLRRFVETSGTVRFEETGA